MYSIFLNRFCDFICVNAVDFWKEGINKGESHGTISIANQKIKQRFENRS